MDINQKKRIKMEKLLQLFSLNQKLMFQNNGIMIHKYKINMVIALQCIKHNKQKFQINNGSINQNYKIIMDKQ